MYRFTPHRDPRLDAGGEVLHRIRTTIRLVQLHQLGREHVGKSLHVRVARTLLICRLRYAGHGQACIGAAYVYYYS